MTDLDDVDRARARIKAAKLLGSYEEHKAELDQALYDALAARVRRHSRPTQPELPGVKT